MKYIFACLLSVFLHQYPFCQNSGSLTIKVKELRNNKGMVGIRLFDQAKGFPSRRNKAIKEFFVTPKNRVAIFVIDNLEYGTYAIGTIHDENENKEFDKNFIGYPKEGFGASNNPKIFIGPPSFNKAKFNFGGNQQSLEIKMIYF